MSSAPSPSPKDGEIVLSARNIAKFFGSVRALNGVNFDIRRGQVTTLFGENGAGKSTLMKVLSGVEKKDGGEILFCGKPIEVKNAIQATRLGIGMVHQHFSLLDEYTVAQNVVLGMEPTRTGTFLSASRRWAFRASCTSEPVAMITAWAFFFRPTSAGSLST